MSGVLNKTFIAAISLAALAVACGDRSVNVSVDVDGICTEYCKTHVAKTDLGVFVLTNKVWKNGVYSKYPHGQVYVKTQDGLLAGPNKSLGLDERCFAEEDFIPSDLGELNLTDDNTTIIFINFTKDGRLESRIMEPISGSKGGTVNGRIYDIFTTTLPSSSTKTEYELVQNELSTLVGTSSNNGRPVWSALQDEGFEIKNMDGTGPQKTPFYTKLGVVDGTKGEGQKEHAFFYVLLDSEIRFMRGDAAAMIPYAPAAQNSIGHLYTPYIQYPFTPEEPSKAPESVDVMTVHFYRGGGMTKGMENTVRGDRTIPASCTYPYDIGVVANGQMVETRGVEYILKTPLLIDPEVEAEGVLPG